MSGSLSLEPREGTLLVEITRTRLAMLYDAAAQGSIIEVDDCRGEVPGRFVCWPRSVRELDPQEYGGEPPRAEVEGIMLPVVSVYG